MPRAAALLALSLLLGLAVASASARTAAPRSGDWPLFGRTADELRHSPLTQITTRNVRRLGRVYTVDLTKLDPAIAEGQESYPVVVGGVVYVTSADARVFALDARSGRKLWEWVPPDHAVFHNFGVVANRGVAYCDGKVFVATIDMHLVSLDPRTGRQLARIAIAEDVPGATPAAGYWETSPPVCAKHRLVLGAGGSEYGVRGFVMAWSTRDLAPAWPTPYWTVPPDRVGWRSASRLAGGGVVWTPVTIDTRTSTVYFGTGSATPLYYDDLRPGPNPRADSLVAVDLRSGEQRWWQQQMTHNEWAYDTAQPPLVYDAKIGGRRRRVVSVATMEGVWFAYDAATGAPLYQQVKVIDRTEHPALKPGVPVAVFPASVGGLNYAPASYDPHTGSIFNAAAETAAIVTKAKLSTTERRRQRVLGDVFLGTQFGTFGSVLKGWHNHGSVSAIDVGTGSRTWKFRTPEPERGGVTTTDAGLGFAGGGDGVLRAFDVRTGSVLWRFQTGAQIASAPTVFELGGKEYLAVTVGGTRTSSAGGKVSQLQVFALGGSARQSPAPRLTQGVVRTEAPAAPAAPARPAALAPASGATIEASAAPVRVWTPSSANTREVSGRLTFGGRPVVGARVRVDRYVLPHATDSHGGFRYPLDVTAPRRHVVGVAAVDGAKVGGKSLLRAAAGAVLAARGGVEAAYRIDGLQARAQKDGTVLVSGRVVFDNGSPAPPVVLSTYRLSGTIRDAAGKPVAGAVVVSRTLDRDFWTISSPSDAHGRYTSFFTAADETSADPVDFAVEVAVGDVSYSFPFGAVVPFRRLRSATMDVRLPAKGEGIQLPHPAARPGAIYEGLLVGVAGADGAPIRPLAARWPDAKGRFTLVLPASTRGRTVRLWELDGQAFARFPQLPGGRVDLAAYPAALPIDAPRDVASIGLP